MSYFGVAWPEPHHSLSNKLFLGYLAGWNKLFLMTLNGRVLPVSKNGYISPPQPQIQCKTLQSSTQQCGLLWQCKPNGWRFPKNAVLYIFKLFFKCMAEPAIKTEKCSKAEMVRKHKSRGELVLKPACPRHMCTVLVASTWSGERRSYRKQDNRRCNWEPKQSVESEHSLSHRKP